MQITAVVEKQEGFEGAQPIERIDNTAHAELSYRPWSNACLLYKSWAQLKIHKWEYPANDTTKEGRPVDHAEFTLYQQIVKGDETTLTFDEQNLDPYTEIGSYSSGTFYDDEGIRQEGDFVTDILKAADNVAVSYTHLKARST